MQRAQALGWRISGCILAHQVSREEGLWERLRAGVAQSGSAAGSQAGLRSG